MCGFNFQIIFVCKFGPVEKHLFGAAATRYAEQAIWIDRWQCELSMEI